MILPWHIHIVVLCHWFLWREKKLEKNPREKPILVLLFFFFYSRPHWWVVSTLNTASQLLLCNVNDARVSIQIKEKKHVTYPFIMTERILLLTCMELLGQLRMSLNQLSLIPGIILPVINYPH